MIEILGCLGFVGVVEYFCRGELNYYDGFVYGCYCVDDWC